MHEHEAFALRLGATAPAAERPAPGRVTLTSRLAAVRSPPPAAVASPLQRRETSDGAAALDPFAVHLLAADGVAGAGAPLPYLDELKQSFGRHAGTLDGATAHVGGAAAESAAAIGARAYATGDRVAFAAAPDRALVGHEAAHLVQQRGGVALDGGVGAAGDPYERHADAVGAAFAAGQSAEALLDAGPGAGSAAAATALQRSPNGGDVMPADGAATADELIKRGWKVWELAGKVKELGEKLTRLAMPIIGKGDRKYLEAARRVQAVASGMIEIYKGCFDLIGTVDEATKKAGKVVKDVGRILDAIDTIVLVTDQRPLYEFLADPGNYDKAKVWAVHSADVFTAAAKLIPDDIPGLPAFVTRMWKGLLSAPANYVNAFLNIMDAYQARIAEKSGFDGGGGASFGYDAHPKWKGSLARFYRDAPSGLQDFMGELKDHRTRDGTDLWSDDVDAVTACAALIRELQAWEGFSNAAAWIGVINAYMARQNAAQRERIDHG